VTTTEVSQIVKPPPSAHRSAAKLDLEQEFGRQVPRLRRIVAGMGLGGPDGDDVLHDVYLAAMKMKQTDRTDRLEPRAKKRRPKTYSLMNQPRSEMRKVVYRLSTLSPLIYLIAEF